MTAPKTEERDLTESLSRLRARINAIAAKESLSGMLAGGEANGQTPEKLQLIEQVHEILSRLEELNTKRV